MWCPKCRNEYKEGYTVCADCGELLVEELPAESDEDIQPVFDNVDMENITQEEAMAKLQQLRESAELAEHLSNVKKEMLDYEHFEKASEKAENYRSSAYALLFVGILGIVFLVLCYLKVLPINVTNNIIMVICMAVIFGGFVFLGIRSFAASKGFDDAAKDEDQLTESILSYFKNSVRCEDVDSRLSDEEKDNTNEMLFFARSTVLREMITEQFGEQTESYLDEMVELIYSRMFEGA